MTRATKILVGAFSVAILAGSYGIASNMADTCGYDPETGNWISSNGIVHEFGTFEHAAACAAKGLLPDNIANRLGVFGTEATKAEGKRLRELNARVKKEREEKAKQENAK